MCCNPFNSHTRNEVGSPILREVNDIMISKANAIGNTLLVPGVFICNGCRRRILRKYSNQFRKNPLSACEVVEDNVFEVTPSTSADVEPLKLEPINDLEEIGDQNIGITFLRARIPKENSQCYSSDEEDADHVDRFFDTKRVQENLCLALDETPIDFEKTRYHSYSTEKYQRFC